MEKNNKKYIHKLKYNKNTTEEKCTNYLFLELKNDISKYAHLSHSPHKQNLFMFDEKHVFITTKTKCKKQ